MGESGREVFFVQASHMMVYVTDEHIDQCPGADGLVTGGTMAVDGFLTHVLNREDIGAAQIL